jgi:hypothetical protein
MSEVVLLTGIVMVLSGIVVYILGNRRVVPNAFLWALFPILHGFHEFAEYMLEFQNNFTLERFEIFFAISGSFVLLAATLEYNGVLGKPLGIITAIIGIISVNYFIFILPENIIEDMEHIILDFGVLKTNPFRFLQGFVMTVIAICAIFFTSLFLHQKSKKGEIGVDSRLTKITIISIILLSIYAFFEGFTSENEIFITLRAISMAFFIVVPVFFIYANSFGLQKLLVIKEGGVPLMGYNFSLGQFFDFYSEEGGDMVLAAGFVAAISAFSGEVLKGGKTLSIRSNRLYFVIAQIESNLYALQSLHVNKKLEKIFHNFGTQFNLDIQNVEQPDEINTKDVKQKIRESFSRYS